MITKNETKLIGYINVDSGQVMVGDPCYIKDNFADKTETSMEDWATAMQKLLPEGVESVNDSYECPDKLPLNYHGASIASCCNDRGGMLEAAFGGSSAICVGSGYGDGTYPVYLEYGNDGMGRINKRLIVDFSL